MIGGYLLAGILAAVLLASAGVGLAALVGRRRGYGGWLFTYLRERSKRVAPPTGQPVHLLICIADHFEPGNGRVTPHIARQRLQRWVDEYPRLCEGFRDSDGRSPRHTFFYPIEMYVPEEVDGLGELCRLGLGEVEIHLHHDDDTSENLERTLLEFRDILAQRHGLLARHRQTGSLAYGFVHGNWALDNSHPDGRWCGVNDEIEILRRTGCYADFTLPSTPDPTQTRKINSIYYAVDDPLEAKSHDTGTDVGRGAVPSDGLMMIQGPLVLNWRRRKWGIIPRIENGCLQGNQPPTLSRLDDWLNARVQVPSRPDWYFVKLHTHGAPEENQRMLLGEPMATFHRGLAERADRDSNFFFHYLTAREMYNLVRAAEAGWQGTVTEARDFELVPSALEAPSDSPDLESSRNSGSDCGTHCVKIEA
jgi:hypothetical protein